MPFKHIDIGKALRTLAERRIDEAMKEGKFDKLSGAGQPLDLEPMPANEDTRLTWWCLRILKQNDYAPEEIRWRKLNDGLRQSLRNAKSEEQVKSLVEQINQLCLKINTLGTNAMKSPISPVDLEEQLSQFRSDALRAQAS